jgi:hypothetical protein
MQDPARPLLASLVAPVASLVPLLLLAASELVGPVRDSTNELGDASQRAAGAFLVILPLAYVVLVALSFVVGRALVESGVRSLGRFVLASLAVAVGLSVLLGFMVSPAHLGSQDLVFSLAAFAGLFAAMAVPGSACWWLLARVPPNPSVERTSLSPLRGHKAAAHVELQGHPHSSSNE